MRRFILISFLLFSCGSPVGQSNEPAFYSSTIWIDRGPDVGQYNSLTADGKGNPHASYYDYTQGDLKYAFLNSEKGEWEIQIVDRLGDVGLYTSIATDSLNRPHIVYYDATNNRLKYAYFNGTKWQIATAFDDQGGMFASLALDSRNVAHISFFAGQEFSLHYMKWDVLRNTTEPVDQVLAPGVVTGARGKNEGIRGGTAIRIRPETQDPVIAYYQPSTGTLRVMRHDPKSENANTTAPALGWVLDEVDGRKVSGTNGNDVGEHVALYIEGESAYHVSYYDKTAADLKYARWDGKRWTTSLVDSDGIVGEWSSIAAPCKKKPGDVVECRPYISYFDATSSDLKLATLSNDSSWVIFRADLSGMTGTYSSMSMVKRGRVGVSYRDLTYSGLKFLLFFPF